MLDIIVIIAATAAAAIIDGYTGEIPEWITIPLMVSGIAYAFFNGFFTESVIVTVATLGVGYLLYYTGELGGGDVLLLAGISAWKPWIELAGIPIPASLIILVLGLMLSSVFFSVFYAILLGRKRKTFLAIPIAYPFLPPALALLYGAAVTAYLGQKYREDLFVREKSVDQLLPEDVLAEPVDALPPGKKVLEKKDIETLKERGVKTVKTLENLPRFGPFILLALLMLLWLESNPLYLQYYASSFLSFNVRLYP
ncbi:MAG: archaeal preflagellin peptidase FlaK [Candidatus Diapherotrites archaeon]|nr:archaeal preflagellin peptidase FlaK [Candidatus Diapherotrites archaeon]MDN5366890.1 archaeal preflagellin peptidase FlaK [Candidatus Diapherotrites archaeon]